MQAVLQVNMQPTAVPDLASLRYEAYNEDIQPGVRRYNVFWQPFEASAVLPSAISITCPDGFQLVKCLLSLLQSLGYSAVLHWVHGHAALPCHPSARYSSREWPLYSSFGNSTGEQCKQAFKIPAHNSPLLRHHLSGGKTGNSCCFAVGAGAGQCFRAASEGLQQVPLLLQRADQALRGVPGAGRAARHPELRHCLGR